MTAEHSFDERVEFERWVKLTQQLRRMLDETTSIRRSLGELGEFVRTASSNRYSVVPGQLQGLGELEQTLSRLDEDLVELRIEVRRLEVERGYMRLGQGGSGA